MKNNVDARKVSFGEFDELVFPKDPTWTKTAGTILTMNQNIARQQKALQDITNNDNTDHSKETTQYIINLYDAVNAAKYIKVYCESSEKRAENKTIIPTGVTEASPPAVLKSLPESSAMMPNRKNTVPRSSSLNTNVNINNDILRNTSDMAQALNMDQSAAGAVVAIMGREVRNFFYQRRRKTTERASNLREMHSIETTSKTTKAANSKQAGCIFNDAVERALFRPQSHY